MEGMGPHVQGRLEPPEAGRGRKEPPLGPVEGGGPAPPGPQSPTWTSEPCLHLRTLLESYEFGLQSWERRIPVVLSPQFVVMTAAQDTHRGDHPLNL